MIKRAFFMMIVMIIASIPVVSPVSAQKVIKWKAQTLWSPAVIPYKTFEAFCQRVKVMSGGRLEITPYPAGAIVPTFECLDAVKNNIIQMMNQWPGYWAGKDPAFAPLSDFIFGYQEPWEIDVFFHYRGGLDLLNELYKPFGVTCIGVTSQGRESFPSKDPIRSMDDYKGKKFRSPQGMTADMLQKLGAAAVILPGPEVYSALDKGVLDGTDWGTPSVNYQMGFQQVCKYFIYPEYRSLAVGDITINTKEWNKLPDDLKAILKEAGRVFFWDQVERVAMADAEAVQKMKEVGAQPIAWDQKEVARLREFVRGTVWKEWSEKSPMTKKVIDAHIAWLKELGRLE
jgi:TRAP-type mannitol/chloroaromatic compound transport system substrate-binding protein